MVTIQYYSNYSIVETQNTEDAEIWSNKQTFGETQPVG